MDAAAHKRQICENSSETDYTIKQQNYIKPTRK